jgi:predicted PurR-regulated permease PerM
VGLAVWIAADFLVPLAWAAIIAIATWPLYVRWSAVFARAPKFVAPLLFTLLVGVLLFGPLALVIHQVSQQSDVVFAWVEKSREGGIPVPPWIANLPLFANEIEQWWRTNLTEPTAATAWFQSLSVEKIVDWVRALGGQLLHRAFMFFFSLIALFVLLREGNGIADRVFDAADRILGDPGERLARRMANAVRGTVNGTVVVAVAEGLLIGIVYGLVGVPNPIVFMLLTMAFAMLPFGAWAAFTIASVVLLFGGGSIWAALAVFGWGAAVMLIGDNFVWPTLVGGAARLPFLFALIGIFGGLEAFGLIGLFIGPVIIAALLTIWREWMPNQAKQ